MIELMNIAILEVNARRRVEVIADEMRDARGRHFDHREPAERHQPMAAATQAPSVRCREPLLDA